MFDPAWLIHIAATILLIGYFIRDELKLRVMIIISSVIYNFYYWLVPNPPLWDAVMTGFLLIAVNIYVLIQVLLERTTFRLTDDEKRLFDGFETLSPGQFRKILKVAKWQDMASDEESVLTREGEPSPSLFYIFDGVISVTKAEHRFRLPQRNFTGEVAFVLKSAATATCIAGSGVRYVEWDVVTLRKLGERHPALGNALNALLTRDLAKKLTESYRPNDAIPPTRETTELL